MTKERARLFKTAKAAIGCVLFPEGAYVAVRYSHTGPMGLHWFNVAATKEGLDNSKHTIYPKHHLDSFCL